MPVLRPLADLTGRELEVLELLADDLSNDEIACRLTVAPLTVKNHVASIIRKCGARSRCGAVAVGFRQSWIR